MAANGKSYWQYVWYYPILIVGLFVFYSFLYSALEELDVLVVASASMAVFITAIVFLYASVQVFPMTLQFGSTRKASIGALSVVELLWGVAMPLVLAACIGLLRGSAATALFIQILPVYIPVQFLAASGGGLLGFAVMRLRKVMRVVSFVLFFVLLFGCFMLFMPMLTRKLSGVPAEVSVLPVIIAVLLAAAGFFGEWLAARKYSV